LPEQRERNSTGEIFFSLLFLDSAKTVDFDSIVGGGLIDLMLSGVLERVETVSRSRSCARIASPFVYPEVKVTIFQSDVRK
jgi:hypothetical protein